MRDKIYARILSATMLLFAATMASVARADDMALVIGINGYPGLAKGAKLSGCVHDAEHMAETLKRYHFDVTLLTDKRATRKEIEQNIERIGKKMDANSRFVCYFAGYGVTNTRDGKKEAALLPVDAQDGKTDKDMPLLALHERIDKLPGSVKSLILDTSFSGALRRDENSASDFTFTGLTSRFYLRQAQRSDRTRAWQLIDPNSADTAEPQIINGGVTLFAAGLRTQTAYETPEGGVFTSALCKQLDKNPARWQDVQANVSAQVAGVTKSEQTPILLPIKYLNSAIFSAAAPPPVVDQSSLADLYSLSRPNVFKVLMRIEPNRSPIQLGEDVRFRLLIGEEGYLIMVGRDPKNKIGVVWPQSDDIEAAHVVKGTIYVPAQGKGAFKADAAGTDLLKAFLFPIGARDAALTMLKYMQSGQDAETARARLQQARVKPGEVFTSEIITLIVNPGASGGK